MLEWHPNQTVHDVLAVPPVNDVLALVTLGLSALSFNVSEVRRNIP
jgi:hypothetical protein